MLRGNTEHCTKGTSWHKAEESSLNTSPRGEMKKHEEEKEKEDGCGQETIGCVTRGRSDWPSVALRQSKEGEFMNLT